MSHEVILGLNGGLLRHTVERDPPATSGECHLSVRSNLIRGMTPTENRNLEYKFAILLATVTSGEPSATQQVHLSCGDQPVSWPS